MKRFLLVVVYVTAAVLAAKDFSIELQSGKTEYTVTAPWSGTYWIFAHTVAKVPVGKQHFSELRWDDGLPMTRRLLQANQTEKKMMLDRVILQANTPRKLHFTFDSAAVTVSKISFLLQKPGRVPKHVQAYKVPFTPPKHPRIDVNPAYLAGLRKNLTVGDNAPVWKSLKNFAVKPYEFKVDPTRELMYDGKVVSAIRQKAFYYLVTGDKKVGREAIELTKKYMTLVTFGNGQDICRRVGDSIFAAALVYDWCYPLLSKAEKTLLHDRMLYYAVEMEVGWPPFRQSVAAGHGNEAQLSRDLFGMALAVYDEDPEPYKMVMYQLWEILRPMKAFTYPSGRHSQGTDYGQYRSQWDFTSALMFRRAFGKELLPKEAALFPYYWYYLRLPDGRFTPEGDANWVWKAMYYPMNDRLLLIAAALYGDPEFKMELQRGGKNSDPVLFLLTNDPGLKAVDNRAGMPLVKRYFDPLPGMTIRTGWNCSSRADDAVITLNGANYHLRNHQHRDLGSFQIYYRGNLVSDLGQYQTYGIPYDGLLAKSSALHSLMRFVAPKAQKPAKAKIWLNSGNEEFPGKVTPADVKALTKGDDYIGGHTPRAGFGPDPVRPVYAFMETDLALSFRDRVKEYTRTFVFRNRSDANRPGTLLILDRFATAMPDIQPIFQLTTIVRPERKDNTLTVSTNLYGKTGKLTMTTLLPAKTNAKLLTGKDAHTFGGVYIPPSNASKREAQGTRTELTGNGGIFLNALQLHDGVLSALPVTAVQHDGRITVNEPGYMTDFGNAGKLTEQAFSIAVPADNTQVLLLDLAPGNWSIGSVTRTVTAGEGSLFAVLGKGTYKVAPKSTGKPVPVTEPKAIPAPAPPCDQVYMDGRLLPGVNPVRKGNVLRVPMKALPGKCVPYQIRGKQLTANGVSFRIPWTDAADPLLPAELAGMLLRMNVQTDVLSRTVQFFSRTDQSFVFYAKAADSAEELREMLYAGKGSWITCGRNITAEIVFDAPQNLNGIVFGLPYGKTRKQLLSVALSADGRKFETVFDGATGGNAEESTVSFKRTQVRSIRLVMKGNSNHEWNSVSFIRFLNAENEK